MIGDRTKIEFDISLKISDLGLPELKKVSFTKCLHICLYTALEIDYNQLRNKHYDLRLYVDALRFQHTMATRVSGAVGRAEVGYFDFKTDLTFIELNYITIPS